MSQKKSKKSTGCLFLPMCCGSDSTQTENFDEIEDKTLERGKVLLEQYEESHRRVSPERPRDLSQQTLKRELDATFVQFEQKTQKQNKENFKILKNEQERTFPGDDIDIILDEQKSESLGNVGKIGFTSKQNITELKEFANITAFKKKRDTSLDKVDNSDENKSSFKKRPPTPKGIGTMSKGALDELKFKSNETISPRQIKQKLAALKDVQGSKTKEIDQAAELSQPLEVNPLSLEKKPIAMKNEKCVEIEQNGREAMNVERQTQEHNIALREDEIGAKRQREETHRNASMDRSHVESKGLDQEDEHSKDCIDGKLQRITTVPLDTSHAEAQKMKQNIQEFDTRTHDTEQSTKESVNTKNAMPKEPEHIKKASKETMPEGIQQDARGSHVSKEAKTTNTSEDTTSHNTQLNTKDSKIEKDVKLRDIEQTTRLPSDTRRQNIQHILTTVDSEQNRRDLENTKSQDIKQFIRSSKNTGEANLGNTVSTVIESNSGRPLDIQQMTSATSKGKDDISKDIEKTDVPKPTAIEEIVREKAGIKPQDIRQSSIAFKDLKNASYDDVSQTTRASSDVKLLGKDQIISISEDITDVKTQEQSKNKLQSEHLKQKVKGVRFSENYDIIPPDDTPMDDNATAQSLPLIIGNPLKTFGPFTIEEEFAYIHSFGNSHLASSSDQDVSYTLQRPEDINVAQGNRESIDEMTNSKFDTSLSFDQPVPPTSPVLGSVEMFRPSKPQLPQEKFTFLNKNVDLPETTGGYVVPLRKGSVNTDLLGVFCTNSDSSVIANYSGSSSEPELAKLIDMKSSDEFLPTKPVIKPATIPLRESSPVIKNIVPDNTSDFSNSFKVLQNADVKVSQTKLGASSLVLGPINSPSSMKTPEKIAIPTQADVRVRPPSARKLEFCKQTHVLHGFLENGMKVTNDHPSNDALLHGIQRTASHTSESFVDGHQSPLSNKVRTVPLSGAFKKSTDAFPVGQSAENMVLKSIKNDSFNDPTALGPGSRRNVTNIPKPDIYCATTVSGKLDTNPTLSKAERRLLQRPTQLKHHLAQDPGNNRMESQDISSKSSFPEVKGASSKDTTANKAIASPRNSAQNIKSGYSLPTTSSGEKSKGRPKLKYVSTDSESDGSMSKMKPQMRQPGSSHQQITHQPKPPDSPACTRVTRQRRKRPPNTKASDSSSGENVQKMSARRAWGAQKHVPAPPLALSAPRHRPPPDRVKDEDERERTSGASTSSLPGPLPPPDLLAPSLFKRRAGQGLPTVTGNVPLPTQQPGRTERQDSNPDPDNRRAENQSTIPQLRRESIVSKASSQPQMSKLREKSISKLDTWRGTSRSQGPLGNQDSTSRYDTRRGPPQPTRSQGNQDSSSRSDAKRGPRIIQDSTSRYDTRRRPPQSTGPQGSQDSTSKSDTRRGPPQSTGPQGSLDSTSRSDTRREPPQSTGPRGSLDSTSRSDTRRGPPQSTGPRGSQDSTSRSDTKTGPPHSTGPQGSQDSTGRSDTRRGPPQSTGPQGSQPRLLAKRSRTNR